MSAINANFIIPGDHKSALLYAVNHWIETCRNAIHDHGCFIVALSGGSTPRKLYEIITSPEYASEIEWDKIHFFWSDERAVPPDHPDSNYASAMKAGLERMPIPPSHIHRMQAEKNIQANAKLYDSEIHKTVQGRSFDLIMLGMGEDGHVASLFPETEGLHVHGSLVSANFIPQKKDWRMTLTLECINDASQIVVYVFGTNKQTMVRQNFHTPPTKPCQLIGTPKSPALWILDSEAGALL